MMFRLACTLVVSLSSIWSATALAAEPVDFTKQVLPIFMEHCAGCHGAEKGLGKLRLHTIAAIQEKRAADEHLLVPGKPDESDLYKRLVLPADDKKRMPKKADPLPKEKIDIIRQWIEQGAAEVVASSKPAEKDKPAENEKPAEEKMPAKPQKEVLPEVEEASPEAIEKLTAAGAQVMPLFAESSLLQVSFALGNEPSGDEDIALLANAAPQVYSLNLAGSKATDAALATLGQLQNLSKLHLERSAVTDAGLAHLAQLKNLRYLNLYDTAITDAGLAHLEGLTNLRKLYLWHTKVSYDAAMALQKKIPGLQVDLGFDHPVIVRKRLNKELERAKKQAEEATAAEAKLAKELEEARKQKEAVQKRLDEINKELSALDGGDKKPAEEAKPAEEKKKDDSAEKKA